MNKKAIAAGSLLVLAASLPALAAPSGGPKAGEWSFSLSGGPDFVLDGDVHGGTNAPVADLGPLNPSLAGVAATLQIESRDYDDVYGTLYAVQGEFAYGLDSRSEMFGALTYGWADGGRLQVGGAAVPALNTTLPVLGRFDDFKYWGLDAGYRYYLGDGGDFLPYVAGRASVQWVDKINATFTIPDANIALNNVRFYGDSTVWGAGLDVGFLWNVAPALSVGLETGLRYHGDLNDDDGDIGGLGLSSINNAGSRWSVPVKARVRFSF